MFVNIVSVLTDLLDGLNQGCQLLEVLNEILCIGDLEEDEGLNLLRETLTADENECKNRRSSLATRGAYLQDVSLNVTGINLGCHVLQEWVIVVKSILGFVAVKYLLLGLISFRIGERHSEITPRGLHSRPQRKSTVSSVRFPRCRGDHKYGINME